MFPPLGARVAFSVITSLPSLRGTHSLSEDRHLVYGDRRRLSCNRSASSLLRFFCADECDSEVPMHRAGSPRFFVSHDI